MRRMKHKKIKRNFIQRFVNQTDTNAVKRDFEAYLTERRNSNE